MQFSTEMQKYSVGFCKNYWLNEKKKWILVLFAKSEKYRFFFRRKPFE